MPCMTDKLSLQQFPFSCPSCDKAVDSHERLKREKVDKTKPPTRASTTTTPGERIITKTHACNKKQGKPRIDDCRIYRNNLLKVKEECPGMFQETIGQNGILSINCYWIRCNFPTDPNAKIEMKDAPFCRANIPANGDVDDNNKHQLVRLFAALRDPPFNNSKESMPKDPISPVELLPFIMNDQRILPLCMAALAASLENFNWHEQSEQKPNEKSLICAPHLASDIILRNDPAHCIGVTATCPSYASDALSVSTFRDLLTSFRIATLRKTTRIHRARQFLEKACAEEELGSRDLIVAMMDNVEHKVLFGKDAGTMKSNTTVAFRQMTEEQPINDGILNDNEPSKRLSGDRLEWKTDVVDKSSVEDICKKYVLPTANDYEAFCSLVLLHMASVLSSREDEWFDDDSNIKVPLLHRMFTQEDFDSNKEQLHATSPSVNDEVEGDEHSDEGITRDLFEKNNIKSSFALPMPFGSVTSTVELMEMVMRVGVRQLKEFYDITDDELNEGAVDNDDYNETDHQHNNLWKTVNKRMNDPNFVRKKMDLPPSQTLLCRDGHSGLIDC